MILLTPCVVKHDAVGNDDGNGCGMNFTVKVIIMAKGCRWGDEVSDGLGSDE